MSALLLTGCGPAGKAKASGNFEGKKIDLIVPFDPGGGYDQYARQLAPALGKKLGAKILVINKPGAGGLLATNELWKAKPDGTEIALFNMTGHVGSALAQAEGVQYQAEKFSYIGRISSEPDLVVVKAGGKLNSFDDVKAVASDKPVRFSATGPGSNEYVGPLVLERTLNFKAELVTGYGGSNEALLGVVAGNVDAYSRSLSSQLPAINSGDCKPVLVIGAERVKEFPDVPTVLEVADDTQRALLETHTKLIESGRTLSGPPGMDPQLLEELRKAFEEVVTDPAYQAEAEKAGRPVGFTSGADVQSVVNELMGSPKEYVDMLKQGFNGR
ncbi:tripartite tricarboxylate transporter substrate binding protein [Micromonospora sp. NBC_00389]|uniref:Bug family tripartite tricarboxylate transporter substrate binding protein n=1 Tax=Micromonospora sp. NBC_00389 TaxID=2903586 RepID=UPI002E2461A5